MTATVAQPRRTPVPAPTEPPAPELVDPLRAGRRARRTLLPRPVKRLAGPALVLVLWQLLSSVGALDARTIPSPRDVWDAGWALTASGKLPSNVWVSLGRVAQGLALGIAGGLVLAVVAGFSRWATTSSTPTWPCCGRSRTSPCSPC
jgi:sulfonate transport system permease protein